jgi:hypothetical protein
MKTKSCFPNAVEIIDTLFDYVITGAASDYLRLDIGQIDTDLAENIRNNTNLELDNYFISLDSNGIRHILSKHGTVDGERLRGQIQVQKRSLWRIPQIIKAAEAIEVVGKSSLNNTLIQFEKQIGVNRYFTIWEIRTVTSLKKTKKHSRIMLHTLFIRQI